MTLLAVDDLRVFFRTPEGDARAVDGVDFAVARGETLALVGESGCGKTVTSLAVMRLFPSPPGKIVGGRIMFDHDGAMQDLAQASERRMRRLRGGAIGMIFQEPMSSLNPLLTVGEQVAEVLRAHAGLDRRAAAAQAIRMLDRVGIPAASRCAGDYPHHLSGGMRQRVMIAAALAGAPGLLIADEPTTALDVTIQGQILTLLRGLRDELGMGMLFITHDLGVVAEIADRVAVMYAGRIVEDGTVAAVFATPRHPYTRALLRSLPRIDRSGAGIRTRLAAIAGQVPSPLAAPAGCAFAARCDFVMPQCRAAMPALAPTQEGQRARCIRWHEIAA